MSFKLITALVITAVMATGCASTQLAEKLRAVWQTRLVRARHVDWLSASLQNHPTRIVRLLHQKQLTMLSQKSATAK